MQNLSRMSKVDIHEMFSGLCDYITGELKNGNRVEIIWINRARSEKCHISLSIKSPQERL
ncbi:MAG UNVERIFIED_CONTAM: hypothetical protein LVQ98_06405 [Rickettsiaceae bacterium]|jgi:predicted RNA-binding protein with RPS1 domain